MQEQLGNETGFTQKNAEIDHASCLQSGACCTEWTVQEKTMSWLDLFDLCNAALASIGAGTDGRTALCRE